MATEGNLQAPTRHALDWQNPEFYDEAACFTELERIFDICHGCRRCVSLCGPWIAFHGSRRHRLSGKLELPAVVEQAGD